jgi:hypothetical protein
MTKSKKSTAPNIRAMRAKQAASPLGQAADFLLGFALPVGKVKAAAAGLRAAGKIGQASALEARAAANTAGKYFGGTGKKSQGLGLPMDRAVDVGGKARMQSESLYPKLPSNSVPGTKRSFDIYEDPYLEGAYRFSGGVKPGRKLSGNPTVNPSIAELPKAKLPKSPKNKPEPYTRDDKLNDYFAGYPTRAPRKRSGR